MIALEKKDGGINPIAVGYTLWHLVAKVAGGGVRDEMVDLLAPHQLRIQCGVRNGIEAAVHVITRL